MDTIYTLDARNNVLLEVVSNMFNLSNESMEYEINLLFHDFLDVLCSKGIRYKDLRTCLVPSLKKKEIILVFDSSQILSSWYGNAVFEKVLPLLNKKTSHSVLVGDYVASSLSQDRLRSELLSSLKQKNQTEFAHSTQYYFVYINNVSNEMLSKLDTHLSEFAPYSGFIDVTFNCFMKLIASTSLINLFIQNKGKIICGHEDDRDNAENINIYDYAFEKNGFQVLSIQESLYNLFLSYKVERPVYKEFEFDSFMSLNSISHKISSINTYDVLIDVNKYQYLRKCKQGRMKRLGFISLEPTELESLIRSKLMNNYIFEMTNLKEHSTKKFNIMIEIVDDSNMPVKFLVSLEYIPQLDTLRPQHNSAIITQI